jgi:hypothetical protein
MGSYHQAGPRPAFYPFALKDVNLQRTDKLPWSDEKDRFAYLFALASAHGRWLSALIVYIRPEILDSRLRRALRLLDGLANLLLCSIIESLNERV